MPNRTEPPKAFSLAEAFNQLQKQINEMKENSSMQIEALQKQFHEFKIPEIPEIINGQIGVQGPIGLQGPKGKEGISGIVGMKGKDGIDGKDGRGGIDGKNGLDGKDGRHGIDGKNFNQKEYLEMIKRQATIMEEFALRIIILENKKPWYKRILPFG